MLRCSSAGFNNIPAFFLFIIFFSNENSLSGIVLRQAISDYDGIESYQPVVNGVGGNLVSIYSARLSTEIARDITSFGNWADWAPTRCLSYPMHAFFGIRSKILSHILINRG